MASRTRRGGSGPWKNRTPEPLDLGRLETAVLGPASGRVDGYDARQSVNREKAYRCPYCHGTIAAGTPHTLALPSGRPDDRRHYHTGCWSRQVNVMRGGRRSPV